MELDQLALMRELGHIGFHLVGHDRGARAAHRLALDNPDSIASLTLMDIVPTTVLLTALRKEVAQSYWHWFFLSRPAPFPERVVEADPDFFFESCLFGWGAAGPEDFDAEKLLAYRQSWRDPATIAGYCNDYRAALRSISQTTRLIKDDVVRSARRFSTEREAQWIDTMTFLPPGRSVLRPWTPPQFQAGISFPIPRRARS